jgi:hypothetical protein
MEAGGENFAMATRKCRLMGGANVCSGSTGKIEKTKEDEMVITPR